MHSSVIFLREAAVQAYFKVKGSISSFPNYMKRSPLAPACDSHLIDSADAAK